MPPGYKIVLLGEGRVGKTSLVSRFLHDTFDENQASTIQACMYASADVPLLDGSGAAVNINVWDTAGQERFHALGPIYYRNANGALLVYDITDADTLEKVRLWIKELRAVVGNHIQLVICGNMLDREKERDVSTETAMAFAKAHGALYFETSAKTGVNVTEAFQALATAIVKATSIESRNISSHSYRSNIITAPSGRREKRGALRIEEDVQNEFIETNRGVVVRSGKGTYNDDYSAVNEATDDVFALSKKDYIYIDGQEQKEKKRKEKATKSVTVNLNAPTYSSEKNNSAELDRRSGCCA